MFFPGINMYVSITRHNHTVVLVPACIVLLLRYFNSQIEQPLFIFFLSCIVLYDPAQVHVATIDRTPGLSAGSSCFSRSIIYLISN